MKPKEIKEKIIVDVESYTGAGGKDKVLISAYLKVSECVERDKVALMRGSSSAVTLSRVKQQIIDKLIHELYGWVPEYINQNLWPVKALTYYGDPSDMISNAEKMEAYLINMRMIAKGE